MPVPGGWQSASLVVNFLGNVRLLYTEIQAMPLVTALLKGKCVLSIWGQPVLTALPQDAYITGLVPDPQTGPVKGFGLIFLVPFFYFHLRRGHAPSCCSSRKTLFAIRVFLLSAEETLWPAPFQFFLFICCFVCFKPELWNYLCSVLELLKRELEGKRRQGKRGRGRRREGGIRKEESQELFLRPTEFQKD